jgi:hypothetical protein
VSIEVEPMTIEVNYDKVHILGETVFCDVCGNQLYDEDLIYKNYKIAKNAYNALNKNK